jgi:esterase/lipase superfamily enzyme
MRLRATSQSSLEQGRSRVMTFSAGWRLLMVCGLLATIALGCRKPPAIIVKKRVPSVIYDTRYEQLLQETDRPLLRGAWGPYVETLDEPVAVVAAAGRATTWEVFFATNRGLEASTAATVQQRFGNAVLPVPSFGRAEVHIPFRRRGESPEMLGESQQLHPAAANAGQSAEATRIDPLTLARFESVQSISRAEFAAGIARQVEASRQRDLLLFVHGFNVNFESSLVRTAQVALDLPFNGAVVSYSWPSQGGVTNYQADEQVNANSVAPFVEFLKELLVAVPPETRVNVVVHSMGNRLVLNALDQLPHPTRQKPIANLVLCAPDVGVRDFQRLAPAATAQAERVTLYASTGDSALIVSKSVHREQRAGDSSPPVVIPGIDTIDVSAVDFDFMGHSYYGSNVDVLADLFRIVKEGRAPSTCAYLTRHEQNGNPYYYFSNYGDVLHWTWHFEDTLRR